jgi:DNA topoisomerase-3
MEGAGKLIDDEELREAMREKGLGTPATRAAVIDGLIFEGYVERKQRDLIATAKGISLITLLRNVRAETLCKPEMTGEWEFKLKQMERGQLSRDTFMLQIRDLTREIVDKVKGFGEKPIEGEFVTLDIKCPQCGGGPFKEDYRTYTCASCGLRVWKSMAAREFEPDEVKELLTQGRVGPLDGFRSKMGRAFSAVVKLGKENKPEFEFENANGGGGSDDTVDLTTLTPVAPCPVCQAGQVYELEKAYACENNLRSQPGKTPCELRIGKVILQKAISTDQMRKLLTEGKTGLIAGFVSKKGKARPFSAFLTLGAKGKIGWEFPPREAKPKRPAPAKAA